jgi:hypothetical protein
MLAGKHQFGEIDGTRVTFIEKGTTKERMEFLKELMEFNGFEVLVKEKPPRKEEDPTTYDVGVTDMVFNPTIWIFDRKLKTPDGRIVTQKYWENKANHTKPQYWEKK